MVTWVSTDWVQQHLDDPGVKVLDPRRPMRYMMGHLKGAVNLPMYKAFDAQTRLRSVDDLAAWIGAAGLGDDVTPVLYDSLDGQYSSMLTWILEYLGRTDVHLMEVFYDQWVKEDRGVYYKPVPGTPATFTPSTNEVVRSDWQAAKDSGAKVVVDFRTPEEYAGETRSPEEVGGHIPGAVNLVWSNLVGKDNSFQAAKADLDRVTADAGLSSGAQVIAYCRTGPRAAVGYMVLKELGYEVSLYDGSFKDWTDRGLPLET